MSTLNDNDLMLIERDGVQYKVESQYVNVGPDGTITSPVEVLTPVDGDGLIVGTVDGVVSSAITAVDGDTITFASDVSSSLEAPISMVDANGDPIAATSSNVVSTSSVPAAFSTTLYDGTGSAQTITNGIDLAGGGGLVWLKSRSSAWDHSLFDTERGAGKLLKSSYDVTELTGGALTQFNSNGFSIDGSGSNYQDGNNHGDTYVSWTFRKAAGFFDIVTYDGDSNPGREIPHNLGSIPGMIIVKCDQDNGTDGITTSWTVHHKSLPNTEILRLNTSDEPATSNHFHNTTPTDQVFTVGSGLWVNNSLGNRSYVAYLFADNPSNGIKCGSYTGSGSSPTTVNIGFEPQWVMIKRTSGGGGDWVMYDNTRGVIDSNQGDMQLVANESLAETNENRIDFHSQGFRLENDAHPTNHSGQTYIYMAIGGYAMEDTTELTFADSTALNELLSGDTITSNGAGQETGQLTADADPSTNTAIVNTSSWPTGDSVNGPATIATASSFNTGSYSNPGFSATTYTGNGGGGSISTGIDLSTKGLIWFKGIGGSGFQTNQHSHFLFDSERNNYGDYLNSAEHDRGMSFADYGWEPQPAADGTISNLQANLGHSNVDYVAWAFRAMPGFFDVVTYDGDPNTAYVPQNISHDLGTAPGMMIIKNYSPYSGVDWIVYHKELGATQFLYLNYEQQATAATNMFNDTEPTDSEFTVGAFSAGTNNNGSSYVAYLFADNPSQGIKCGTYNGNDGSQTIDCGFGSDKAAFIMVKCSSHSSPSGWIMCDTSRPDGSDQTLHDIYANLKVSQLHNGRIGSVAGGFTLNDGNNDVNRAGRTYIYMAISETNGSFGNLASNQIKATGVTGTFQVGANVKGADYIYEITSQSSAITAVDGSTLTFADQDGLVQMTAPVSTDTGTATGFTYGSYTIPTFATTLYNGTGGSNTIANGIDLAGEGGLVWTKWRSGGSYTSESHALLDTERSSGTAEDTYGMATPYLRSDLQNQQTNANLINFNSNGYEITSNSSLLNHSSGGAYVSWTFRKAPGFFDVVAYSGSGAAGNVSIAHNLGSVPGMMIVKCTSHSSTNWYVYHNSLGATKYLNLNNSNAMGDSDGPWHDTEPTSTHFTLGNYPDVSWGGRDYVAYLFADNPSNGIKCGTYTGNGLPQTIDVGFEPQWIMIKDINSEYREWTIVDNVRGGGSGNTGKMLQASTNREELSTSIDFVSNGFEVYDASSEVNWYDHNYIYVAISTDVGITGELETNQASLQGITGTFSVGQTVTGSAQVADHPLTSEIEFKSVNGSSGTGEFNGTDCTLNARIWTLETASNINGPWTVVDTYIDSDANASQDGDTPWTTGAPTLQPNTIYRVKVKYQTADSAPVESTYHTFKTGAS